ncbi:OmpA family protein [Sabulicella rubraurantiaca]|uniref:OmpA family protein n=1 Tax=Sabulicella rubraurantiaca TaxID=2811429 RepID=UPI001A96E9FB|nr:OmpA family protein [Sabulicella rubraurantiaca]
MSLKKALLAATVLSLPVAAQAQPVTGLYIGAGAGTNFRQQSEFSYATTPIGAAELAGAGIGGNVRVRTNWGYAAVGAIGWGFGNGIRAEIEGNYRQNEVDNVRILGGTGSSRGRIHQYGVMANAYYDFNAFAAMSPIPGITPYLGIGAGYVWNDWRSVGGGAALPGNRAASVFINDRDGRFAYQAIAGVAYNLGAVVPGLAITAEYRFMGTLEPHLATASAAFLPTQPIASRTQVATYKSTPENYNHSILLGVRYAFNAPRPAPAVAVAPAPAPAPAPARTYLVFFDWDRADLTDRARQIIAEAAQNSQRVGATRIEVSGHADRSGTPQYNQRLSERRAEAVAAELVRRGVARSQIGVQAFGESRPLVPTADGVREPQNRRVEIVLR